MIEVSRPPEYARTIFTLVSERNVDVLRRLDEFATWRDETQPIDRVRDGHMTDLIVLIAHNRAELLFADQLHRLHAEARAENTIEGGRRSTALQVTEHSAAGFLPRSGRDLTRNNCADS